MGDYFDFRPTVDGQPVDPQSDGGTVTALALFSDVSRDTSVALANVQVSRVLPGVYRFTFDSLDPGRYWTSTTWTPATDADAVVTDGRVDLPSDPTLVCSVEDVAVRLGLTLPVDPTVRERIEGVIRDAQADVEDYLNRPLTAVAHTVSDVWPHLGYDLMDPRAWRLEGYYDDLVQILGYTLNDDSTYDVTVLVGLDGPRERGVVRYVTAHAAETLRVDPVAPLGKRKASSISAEGQSVSYEAEASASMTQNAGQPGSAPNIKTLARLRRVSVYRRPVPARPPWPYDIATPLDL